MNLQQKIKELAASTSGNKTSVSAGEMTKEKIAHEILKKLPKKQKEMNRDSTEHLITRQPASDIHHILTTNGFKLDKKESKMNAPVYKHKNGMTVHHHYTSYVPKTMEQNHLHIKSAKK